MNLRFLVVVAPLVLLGCGPTGTVITPIGTSAGTGTGTGAGTGGGAGTGTGAATGTGTGTGAATGTGTGAGTGGTTGTGTGTGTGSTWTGTGAGTGTGSTWSTWSGTTTGTTSGTIPGWSCPSSYYGATDGCDCGCGVPDPDCASSLATACDYNNCPFGQVPSPTSNELCITPVCGDGTVDYGEDCDDGNTTPGDGCDAFCQTEAPGGWTCYAGYYDANDGCDCGCGIPDPDCPDALATSCDWCDDYGSCSTGYGCPGDIDPTNNAVCVP